MFFRTLQDGCLQIIRNDFNTHRCRDFRYLPGGIKFAGLGVDPEGYNGVGILVGGEQEIAGRVDGKIAGGIAPG